MVLVSRWVRAVWPSMAGDRAAGTPCGNGSRCCAPLTSGNVRRMFAHSNQNWWWTAHPAAH
ncbi:MULTISPECIES: trp operon leader peptide [unclassified Streptomyces]|uniref:trp operon leader peptide n=1 Tax=unclassified Streptomyces TaxID=2593676 RepID=UPI00386473C4